MRVEPRGVASDQPHDDTATISDDRKPLPAGHPITWGAIGETEPYPFPVFS